MKQNLLNMLWAFLCLIFPTMAWADVPFDMPTVEQPSIPNRSVKVTDFGARSDASTLCTDAFNKAINHLAAQGGGHLIVPAGVWLTGPVTLQSHIDLHLEAGATLLFSPDANCYPLIETSFEGVKAVKRQSPISGTDLTDVAITGRGVIDGNGAHWRPLKKFKVTDNEWKALTSEHGTVNDKGDYWTPDGDRYTTRPNLLKLTSCKRILLQGVTFKDSPCWTLHPLMCQDVTIEDITVRAPSYAQNSDALDLESCNRAIIKNSVFDVGDDAICIKSGRDEEGRKRGMPTENVIIEGCIVYHGHGGFVIGSEMSGGARNIYVKDCQFLGTDNGLRFKSTRGRGGVVEKIYIDNVAMSAISGDAILFNLYYANKQKPGETVAPMPVDETTPSFRDIHISNVTCIGSKHGIMINGLPEMPVKDITLRNVSITAKEESVMNFYENVLQENVQVEVEEK